MSKKQTYKLSNLPGIKKRLVDAHWINDAREIESLIEPGYACTRAGDHGAINVWETDSGELRGELMYHGTTADSRIFSNYKEAEECVCDWIKSIK